MNNYTQQFHHNVFPGYKPAISFDQLMLDFWHTKAIPFVELAFDFDVESTYEYARVHDHDIFLNPAPEVNKKLFFEQKGWDWAYAAHHCGWKQCIVLGQSEPSRHLIATSTEAPTTEFVPPVRSELFQDLQKQFVNKGLPLERLMILKLDVGGWIQPHRDTKVDPNHSTINYFWMPLQETTQGVKTYPYGYADSKVGSLYLFDQQNYVHSAINNLPIPRFVAWGKIDYQKISKDVQQQIFDATKRQWFDSK